MIRLGAASISVLCFCAVASAAFVPLPDSQGIQYLFVSPQPLQLAAACSIAVSALVAAYVLVATIARRRGPAVAREARTGRWLSPAMALGAVVFGVLPAVPGIGQRGAPVGYLLYDLRWWWTAAIAVWMVARADRLLGGPLRRAFAIRHLVALDVLLFVSVIAWSIVTTPHLRFTSELHGDEPKYLRYCELWYQGGVLEISGKKLLTDPAVARRPMLHRIPGVIARGAAEEVPAFVDDLRQFAAAPRDFRWNRAHGEGGFLAGKRGGVYQRYQPGTSVFLFPGYFVDRLTAASPGYQEEFPSSLVMTNVMMLIVYGACAIALFHLLRHVFADAIAWAWAAIAMVTLPAGAFAFQLYPEVPALLLFLVAATYVLFHADRSSRGLAAAAGVAAAMLAWLHPRFLLLSLLLAVWGFVRTGDGARRAFAGACAAVYLSVGAYAYHVTGSWLPTALWDATEPAVLNAANTPVKLLAYALHRTWGVIPHSPLLLLVAPGLALLARRSKPHALFLIAAGLALGLPAAGHTLTAAGGTPGRLIVAVVPIFVWPAAFLVREYWKSPAMRAAAMLLIVLSLEAGVAYNVGHLHKEIGPIHTAGLSGWRPNLAFPVIGDEGWLAAPGNVLLLLSIVALLTTACVYVAARARSTVTPADRPASTPTARTVTACALVTLVTATLATSANGVWARDEYLLDDAKARARAIDALVSQTRCVLCFTSRERTIDWRWMLPNPARDIHVESPVDGRKVTLDVSLLGDEQSAGFARTRVDFGDGLVTPWMGLVGRRQLTHTYDRPGDYRIAVWVRLRNGEERADRRTITVQ